MSHQEPALLNEQNHAIENELRAFELISELSDAIVAEEVLVVEAVWSAINSDGAVQSLAIAFTDENQAARDAGIQLFLRTVGNSIKNAVEAEAKKRYDALVDSVGESAAQDAEDDAR